VGKLRFLAGPLLFLAVSACAPSFTQDRVYFNNLAMAPGGMIGTTPTRAADEALKAIQKAEKSYGSKDQLLLGMDLGMANHVAAHYRTSEEIFRKTDRLAEKLFTQSFTGILLSYQLNDYSLPYKGLPFERVMVNLLNSLNYASTGDWNGALVETRKISEKLVEYNRMYPQAAGAEGKYSRFEGSAQQLLSSHHISYNPSKLNHYTDDAFARYLSGVFEEAQVQSGAGSYQSAYLSYEKAWRTYKKYRFLYHTPIPAFLAPALLRTSEAAGRANEFRRWRTAYPDVSYRSASEYERLGHILFVGYNGKIFHLKQKRLVFPLPIMGTVSMVSFAVPEPAGGDAEITVHEISVARTDGTPVLQASSETGDNLIALGLTNFKDHLDRVILREAIRSILKTVEQVTAQRVAYRQGGVLGELGAMVGGSIFAVASDQADIRSWRLLPASIDCSMIDLPPGTYDLVIRTRNSFSTGGVLRERITVTPGQYLLIRTVNPPPARPGK